MIPHVTSPMNDLLFAFLELSLTMFNEIVSIHQPLVKIITNVQDQTLTSNLLDKINASIECAICSESMHVPFISECGHSFCYECLFSWFENKVNCPTCRHELDKVPVLNLKLMEISKVMVDLAIDVATDEEKEKLIKQRQDAEVGYEEDRKVKRLFGDIFRSVTTLLDTSDGVPRCGNCHWEANGSTCLHCGTRFRVPARNADGDDSDTEVFYNTTAPYTHEEPDEYDTEDSFVDTRGAEEINNDVYLLLSEDNDQDVDQDDLGDWQGFEEETTDNVRDYRHDRIVINGHDQDDLAQDDYFDEHEEEFEGSDDLRSALEDFHEGHLQEDDVRRLRRQAVVISDDEE